MNNNSDWPQWLHYSWNLEIDEPGSLFRLADRRLCMFTEYGGDQTNTIIHPGDWIIRQVQ